MPQRVKPVEGRYGSLTVLGRATGKSTKDALWECLCDCGKKVIAKGCSLRKGRISCGCMFKQYTTHDHARSSGFSPTYTSWYAAKARCTNPNHKQWKDYGGRGITMCDRWMNSFEAFLQDMGERPEGKTLDRVKGHIGYEPGNCKWSNRKEQNRNSRRVVATPEIREKIKQLEGSMTKSKIAKEVGVSVCTVSRVIRGVSWQ